MIPGIRKAIWIALPPVTALLWFSTLDILLEDGGGHVAGNTAGTQPAMSRPRNRSPLVEGSREVRIRPGSLGVARPSDPDGDRLTVTIRAVPRGLVRNGAREVRAGDVLEPEDLPKLVFLPEPGLYGAAGSLRYVVEDGRGGQAEGAVEVMVAGASDNERATPVADNGHQAGVEPRFREWRSPGNPNAPMRPSAASRLAADARGRATSPSAPMSAPAPRQPSPQIPPPEELAPASKPAQQLSSGAIAAEAQATALPPGGTQVASLASVVQAGLNGQVAPTHEPSVAMQRLTPSRVAASLPRPASVPSQATAENRGQEAQTFQECSGCPEMVRVPGGSFMMGDRNREGYAAPTHRVSVQHFSLGRYPVTVGEWRACLAEAGCAPVSNLAAVEDRTPMHNVSWDDVRQYIAWLSRKAGRPYRLPSEAEWEYAVRAGTMTRYWWGERVGTTLADCGDCGGRQGLRAPLPVGSFRPNPFGLYDMPGGVAEWTQDCWFPDYRGAPSDGSAREVRNCMKRVLRGGSFRSSHEDITSAARWNYDAPIRYLPNGFRVARDD
ncbi:MAG: SUMF1/EgtB/PvdO family nonheme iron enzyme [Acetobacteraceae bacterium]|nr:SUMF1/EgtB/PvdO family nonheme iron enzyme [Acetobacteraceae bacterium]